ncbi:MAG: hypothetical protein ACKVQQ_24180 [Burkholderiales bacterium]
MTPSKLFAFFIILLPMVTNSQERKKVGDGDRLTYQNQVLSQDDKKVLSRPGTIFPANYAATANGYTIKFEAGRVENYDNNHTLLSGVSRGANFSFNEKELFRWFPEDLTPGEKKQISHTFPNTTRPACGPGVNTFAVNVVDGKHTVVVNGERSTLAVKIISFDGNGVDSCGRGKVQRNFIFSPDLNLVLEYTFMIFDTDGNLLPNWSNSMVLKEIKQK